MPRRIDICIAVHHAISNKFGIFQCRDHGEDPFLLRPGQMRLKTNQIIHRSRKVILSELNDGVGFLARMRIRKTNRLHRAESKSVFSSSRHHFHGHTSFEDLAVFKSMGLCFFRTDQFPNEILVFLLIHRTVDIVRGSLVVPGSQKSG